MGVSVWPVSGEVSRRLRAFQESHLFPTRYGLAEYRPSPFWAEASRGIFAFGLKDAIAVHSLSRFLGAEDLGKWRRWRDRRARFHRFADWVGRIGALLPTPVWRFPDRIASPWLRASLHFGASRERALAQRAFRRVTSGSGGLTFEDVKQIPVLADHHETAPILSFYVAAMLSILLPMLRKEKPQQVLEIGPSEAVLAISLRTLLGCRFMLVDLPELLPLALAMISYYLPGATVALPHEVEAHPEHLEADFVLLVPEQVDKVATGSVDLAVNTSSFQEMNYDLIGRYFQVIERCVRPGGLFYCLNETAFRRHADGVPIEFAKYPWSPMFEDIFSEPFLYWDLVGGWPRRHRLQRRRSQP